MDPNVTNETLQLARGVMGGGQSVFDNPPMTYKAQVDSMKAAGLALANNMMWYDLSPLVGFAYPLTDMLIKHFPRRPGDGGDSYHWKMYTATNSTKVPFGVPEARRNAAIEFTGKDYTATFAHMASESFTTFQAQFASKNLNPDARGQQTLNTLNNARIQEELALLGGNGTTNGILIGQAATPTCADVTTGGTITQGTTVYVDVVALTQMGFDFVGGAGKCAATATLYARVSRTSPLQTVADTVGGYCGKISSQQTIVIASDGLSTHSIAASTTPVQGAAGYAWFVRNANTTTYLWGVSGAANIVITSAAGLATAITNGDTDFGTDYSKTSTYLPDGLIPLICGIGQGASVGTHGTPGGADTASGAYIHVGANGDTLTATGAGGCAEIDNMLQDRFTKFRLSFDDLWVSYDMMLALRDVVIGGGQAPLYRLNVDTDKVNSMAAGGLAGGTVIGSYLNPFGMSIGSGGTGKVIPIHCHPFLAPGWILGTSDKLPYNLPNNLPLAEVVTMQEWYQMDWPTTQLQWESGLYLSAVLAMRFGPAFGAIQNMSSNYA